MDKINLHYIFSYLTNDKNFLSTIVEEKPIIANIKKNRSKKINLISDIVIEYLPLSPYETQSYNMLPHKIKLCLTPDYFRLGIKNVIEKNLNVINISFLSSLNILLRPEIYKLSIDDQIKNYILLENFICHKIQRNYQVDKIKKTKKVQELNNELIKDLTEGRVTHRLIQYIVNIFEINLLVFDLTKMNIYLYWTKGTKYPHFNTFCNVYCMSYVQGNYEPIMPMDGKIDEKQRRNIYLYILTNIHEIKSMPELRLAEYSLIYLNTWDIDIKMYLQIVENFYHRTMIDSKKMFEELKI
jgi:hypothetical protein